MAQVSDYFGGKGMQIPTDNRQATMIFLSDKKTVLSYNNRNNCVGVQV